VAIRSRSGVDGLIADTERERAVNDVERLIEVRRRTTPETRDCRDVVAPLTFPTMNSWTVRDHMEAIYEKTGAGDRYELAALAS
jgi:hypothetical protein